MSALLHPSTTDQPYRAVPLTAFAFEDEAEALARLLPLAELHLEERRQTDELARRLVHAARAGRKEQGGIDAFLTEYGLSTEEGVILMCLAEALLRIPDAATADDLIDDKIMGGDWARHLGHSGSLLVNASTWGLMLTGRVIGLKETSGMLGRLIGRTGEPVIRRAMRQAMRIMGDQFVLGRSIGEALERAKTEQAKGYRYSYDMLGEAARTGDDAERYFQRYLTAIEAIGKAAGKGGSPHIENLMLRPGLSVKLSAIHPRFDASQIGRLKGELGERMRKLVRAAQAADVSLTVDAEESDRLELTLELFEAALRDPALKGWHGLGLAVQAYGKRALPALRRLADLSRDSGHRLPVRLVKGAYWDSEIKWAQERGLLGYPVFTRKANTDVSYLACARYLLSEPGAFYPQFATHNAQTVAAIHTMAGDAPYEFQRLHGMGEALYREVVPQEKLGRACRIYAPVGEHEDLLAYLVRRLLENGANTSFVNRLADEELPVAEIVRDPVERVQATEPKANPRIPLPAGIFGVQRENSAGLALWEAPEREKLLAAMRPALASPLSVGPIVAGRELGTANGEALLSPHDRRITIGRVRSATAPTRSRQRWSRHARRKPAGTGLAATRARKSWSGPPISLRTIIRN